MQCISIRHHACSVRRLRTGVSNSIYQRLRVHGDSARFFHQLVRGRHGASHGRAQGPRAEQRLGVPTERFEFEPRVNHATHVPHLGLDAFSVEFESKENQRDISNPITYGTYMITDSHDDSRTSMILQFLSARS